MATQTNLDLKSYIAPIETRMVYGASELKQVYKKYLTRGMIFSLILYFMLIGTYIGVNAYDRNREAEYKIKRDIEIKKFETETETKDNADELKQPEVPKTTESVFKADDALTPEPVAKEKAELETIKKVEDMEKIKAYVSSEGDENFDPTKETNNLKLKDKVIEQNVSKDKDIVKTNVVKNNEVWQVDKAPVAVNLTTVQGSMKYPEIALQNGTEGNVTVRVLVGPDGSVVNIDKFSGPEVFRDEVSSKVINLQFIPALQQGQAVRCYISVPFKFELKGKFKKDEDIKKIDDTKKEDVKENKEENK